jgi:hypothetical protein
MSSTKIADFPEYLDGSGSPDIFGTSTFKVKIQDTKYRLEQAPENENHINHLSIVGMCAFVFALATIIFNIVPVITTNTDSSSTNTTKEIGQSMTGGFVAYIVVQVILLLLFCIAIVLGFCQYRKSKLFSDSEKMEISGLIFFGIFFCVGILGFIQFDKSNCAVETNFAFIWIYLFFLILFVVINRQFCCIIKHLRDENKRQNSKHEPLLQQSSTIGNIENAFIFIREKEENKGKKEDEESLLSKDRSESPKSHSFTVSPAQQPINDHQNNPFENFNKFDDL